ncbi:MAG TPA: sulfurtransferase [Candidatus Hypogeohydataceae bacterium YC40]
MKMLFNVFQVFVTLTLFYLGESLAGSYPNSNILVETDWLATHLHDTDLRIIDMQGSRDAYLQGHIPGAVYLDLDEIVSAIKGVSKKVYLPQANQGAKEPENIAEYCASWGPEAGETNVELAEIIIRNASIGNDTMVVMYDDAQGLYAAQFFWALELLGHNKVALLNGGIAKWRSEARPLSIDIPRVEARSFKAQIKPEVATDAVWVLKTLGNPQVILLDARSKAEYTGTARLSKRVGHIPGAILLEWSNAINPTTETFKTYEELRNLLEGVGVTKDKTIVPYCQAGIRASHTYFVLRLLGYDKVRLYYPSWNEWGNKDTLPVEK